MSLPKIAVIVAGGAGTRMQGVVPKQFLLVGGKPLLYYTLKSFLEAYDDMQIILVLPEQHMAAGQEIIDAFFNYNRIRLTVGGISRFESVKNGLSLVEAEDAILFVHDAVRCLVSPTLIKDCYEAALEMGSAIPVVDVKDSIRLVTEDGNEVLDRNRVKLVQTPQTFHSKILLPAYNIDFKEKFTDDATVVEAFGLKLNLVPGEENNFKITTPADLTRAEGILTTSL
ncbi:MAG: 2-C-methyl-D-erythritol 4-phosphate cytidylyltransferase [Ferruginibacter sp.]